MSLIKTTFTETRPPDIARDAWRDMSRDVHLKAAEYWQQKILPKHFKINAKTKYGHKKRTRVYQKEKERRAKMGRPYRRGQPPIMLGGRVDNVLTGHMMRMLQGSQVLRAYPSRATLTMHGPRYITMRPFESNQPDKAREITTVTDDERKTLSEIMDKRLQVRMDRYRRRRTTTP